MAITTFASFGGVGDNSTDNASAFASAEASAAQRIWLEEGTYYTTSAQSSLTKHYWGPGKIRLSNGNYLPARTTWMATEPSQAPTQGVTGWFAGDTSRVEPEWITLGAFRKGLSERYYETTVIPHSSWFDNNAGWSGISARLAANAAAGATTVTLNNVGGFAVGQVIGFQHDIVGPATGQTFNVTITAVNTGANQISFNPGLNQAYTTDMVVTHGIRTNHMLHYERIRHYGGGDGYGDVKRTQGNYVKLPGQQHIFETATTGMYGGDAYINQPGNFMTGIEMHFYDQGIDGAMLGDTKSFIRDNDTGASSAVWLANQVQSAGTKPIDAAYSLAGRFRIGLDFAKADLTTGMSPGDGLNAAISMAKGHRIVMGSTASLTARGGSPIYGTLFGNVPGDMYIESGNDGLSDYIGLRFNRAGGSDGRLRLTPSALLTNVPISTSQYIIVGGDVGLGAAGLLVFGPGSGNYLSKSGQDLYWNRQGSAYRVALVGIDV